MGGEHRIGKIHAKITIVEAREIRKWWVDNVHRLGGTPRVRAKDLQAEIGAKYDLHPRTIASILTGNSHKEPVK